MAQISGILFDKDGTLFDFQATWGAWARAFLDEMAGGDDARARRMGRAIGYDDATASFHPSSPVIAGTPGDLAALLAPFLPHITRPAMIERMNASAAAAPQVEAVPLGPLLSDLRARGYVLGVATNDAEHPARAHLDAAGVTAYFSFVAGYDSGHGGKPDPGQLLAFAAHSGLAADRIAMVGDSTHDLVAGRAAGMVTIGVLTGPADRGELRPHADHVVEDIGALPGLLTALSPE